MADPLAGYREILNKDRSLTYISFPDSGKGCPVSEGELYRLLTCAVEIALCQRTRENGLWVWRAHFTRYQYEGKPRFLARSGGDDYGYTTDPDLSPSAQDDEDPGTLASTHPLENPRNLGPPPEPEPVDRDQVDKLASTVAARARFERERDDGRRELERMTPVERLTRLREQMHQAGPSVELRREAKRARGQAKRSNSSVR